MMAKEPAERIASAREGITRLAPFLAPAPSRPADRRDSPSPATQAPVGSDPSKAQWPPAVFVLAPLALAATGLLLWWLVKVVLLGR